jgi:acyl-CoA dehydrogenase
METILRYGSSSHHEEWLTPLLNGDIRSCFAMTEPAVASSDATNMEATVVDQGDGKVVVRLLCGLLIERYLCVALFF